MAPRGCLCVVLLSLLVSFTLSLPLDNVQENQTPETTSSEVGVTPDVPQTSKASNAPEARNVQEAAEESNIQQESEHSTLARPFLPSRPHQLPKLAPSIVPNLLTSPQPPNPTRSIVLHFTGVIPKYETTASPHAVTASSHNAVGYGSTNAPVDVAAGDDQQSYPLGFEEGNNITDEDNLVDVVASEDKYNNVKSMEKKALESSEIESTTAVIPETNGGSSEDESKPVFVVTSAPGASIENKDVEVKATTDITKDKGEGVNDEDTEVKAESEKVKVEVNNEENEAIVNGDVDDDGGDGDDENENNNENRNGTIVNSVVNNENDDDADEENNDDALKEIHDETYNGEAQNDEHNNSVETDDEKVENDNENESNETEENGENDENDENDNESDENGENDDDNDNKNDDNEVEDPDAPLTVQTRNSPALPLVPDDDTTTLNNGVNDNTNDDNDNDSVDDNNVVDEAKVGAVGEKDDEAEEDDDDGDDDDDDEDDEMETVEGPPPTERVIDLEEAERLFADKQDVDEQVEGSGDIHEESEAKPEYSHVHDAKSDNHTDSKGDKPSHDNRDDQTDHTVDSKLHGDTEEDKERKKRIFIIVGVAVGGVALFTIAFFVSRRCKEKGEFKPMKKSAHQTDPEAIEFRPVGHTRSAPNGDANNTRDGNANNAPLFRKGPSMGPPSPRFHRKAEGKFEFPADSSNGKQLSPTTIPSAVTPLLGESPSNIDPLINGMDKLKYIDDSTDDEGGVSVPGKLLPPRSRDPTLTKVTEETTPTAAARPSSLASQQATPTATRTNQSNGSTTNGSVKG